MRVYSEISHKHQFYFWFELVMPRNGMKAKLVGEEDDFSSLFFASLSLFLFFSRELWSEIEWRGGKDVMKKGPADKVGAQQNSSRRTYILVFKSYGKIWFPCSDTPRPFCLLVGCYDSINPLNKEIALLLYANQAV